MRRNKNIQGILVDKEEIKLEMFADDVTAFLRNTRSLEALLHTASYYGRDCHFLQKYTRESHDQNSRCLFYI